MHDNMLIDLSKYRLQTAQEFLETSELCIRGKKYKGSRNRSYYSIFASIRSIIALDGMEKILKSILELYLILENTILKMERLIKNIQTS